MKKKKSPKPPSGVKPRFTKASPPPKQHRVKNVEPKYGWYKESRSFDEFFGDLGVPKHIADNILIESIRVKGNERTEPRFLQRIWRGETMFDAPGTWIQFREGSATPKAPNEPILYELFVEETPDWQDKHGPEIVAIYNRIVRKLGLSDEMLVETEEESDLFGDMEDEEDDLFADLIDTTDEGLFDDLDDLFDVDEDDDLFGDL